MADTPISFVKAITQFFGIAPGTAVSEYKALSEADKVELSTLLQPLVPHTPYTPKA